MSVILLQKKIKCNTIINGMLMSEIIDQDSSKSEKSGLLGVQVHVGPPMKVEYKNFRFKKIKL